MNVETTPIGALADYVQAHTERGECKCRQCVDVGTRPDPIGHTADLVFFKVMEVGASRDEFIRLSKESQHGSFADVDVFDGKEHGYIELGAWLGDQGLALQYMGLGALLGVFTLLTPYTIFRSAVTSKNLALRIAGAGYVTVRAKEVKP